MLQELPASTGGPARSKQAPGAVRAGLNPTKGEIRRFELHNDNGVERLLDAMNRAYQAYKLASAERSRVQAIRRDLPSPDGYFAFRQALIRETCALVEYRRALDVWAAAAVPTPARGPAG